MNNLQIFKNADFGSIRTLEQDGKVLFCGKDVAEALGYQRPADAITAHCKGVCVLPTPSNGGVQRMKFITEGDVYRLITHSRLPVAEQFEYWVFDEVLPAIRKNGGYIAGQETMTDAELMATALLMAKKTIDNKQAEIERKQAQITEMQPKAVFADAVSSSKHTILVGELAKILRQNGVDTGEKRLFETLRKEGYLVRRKGSDYNMPTRRSMDMGLFEIKETAVCHSNGHTTVSKTPKVTGKGQEYFINRFLSK